MESSTYLYLVLILMLIGLIAIFVLINILSGIKKQLSIKGSDGPNEDIASLKRELSNIKEILSAVNRHIEFITHGTFTATINAKITNKNNNNMEKKIEETNNEGDEVVAFSPTVADNSATGSQILDGTLSGSYDSKSSGGSDPGSGPK